MEEETKETNNQVKAEPKPKRARLVMIFGVTLALVMAVLVVFLKVKKEKKAIVPEVPVPKFSSPYKTLVGQYLVEFDLDPERLSLPPSLSVFEIQESPLDEIFIRDLAENLGFADEPLVNQDPLLGDTWLYFGTGYSLRVIPGKKIIDFKTGLTPRGTFIGSIDEDLAQNKALAFLEDNGFLETSDLTLHKITPIAVGLEGHIDPNGSPTMVSLSFVKTFNGFKVLAASAETGIVNVTLNADYEILSVYLDDLPVVSQGSAYPTKSFDEVVSSSEKEASLQSLADGKLNPSDVVIRVSKIVITDIEVAYVQEIASPETYLQPVYLLKGTATLEDGSKVKALMYLPALKRNYLR